MSNYVSIENSIEVSYVEKTDSTGYSDLHYHNAYEIYIFQKGNRNYVINDKFIELSERDVVLIKPHLLHATDGGSYKRYLINFRQEYLDSFFTKAANKKLLRCFEYDKIHLSQSMYEQVISLVKNLNSDKSDFISFCKILEIFYLAASTSATPQTSPQNKLISEIVEYIGKNFSKINTLDEIAEKFYITKFYLCRLFKENTGVPVIKYINTLKIRHACNLLSDTDKKSSEIAAVAGFNTSMYFCKVFKQICGMTPMDYRKKIKSDKNSETL